MAIPMRDKILACDDIQRELLEVPEWAVVIEVRGMSGGDRAVMMDHMQAGGVKASTVYVDAVIKSSFDPDSGERLFQDSDRDALLGKSSAALDRIATLAMRLSGMEQEAVDEAKRQFPEASA
jgi:hypothetical protein